MLQVLVWSSVLRKRRLIETSFLLLVGRIYYLRVYAEFDHLKEVIVFLVLPLSHVHYPLPMAADQVDGHVIDKDASLASLLCVKIHLNIFFGHFPMSLCGGIFC